MGLRIWQIILLWGLLSMGILSSAKISLAEVGVLTLGKKTEYSLSGQLELLEDKKQQVHLKDVLAGRFDDGFVYRQGAQLLNLGLVDSSYWIRARFRTEDLQGRQGWYLRLGNPHIDKIELTLVRNGKVFETHRTGDKYPFWERPFKHRLFVFPFETEAGEDWDILIKAQVDGRGFLPLDIISSDILVQQSSQTKVFFGLVFGMMLVAFFYALLGNLTTSGEEPIWLWLYLLSLIMFHFTREKLDFEFLLASWPVLSSRQALLWGNLTWVTACLFCCSYFKTVKNSPRLDKALKIQAGVQSLGILFLLKSAQASLLFLCVFGTSACLIILGTAINYWMRNETQAKIFLTIWVWVIFGALVHILQLNNFIPSNVFTTNAFLIGSGIQACTLVLSLSYNLNLTKETFRNALHQTVRREYHASKLYRSLEKFVPTEMLSIMGKKDLTDIELGDYIKRSMTVLFSDIRSFTSMSENMSPEDNFRFLNAYLKRMEASVRTHHGFIDKYTGDGIMALYPCSADSAVKSAIAMQKSISIQNRNRQRYGHIPIQVGIGLNTGPLILGFLGGNGYMESTVISDAVNTASRTESLTKVYGSKVIITANTLQALRHPENFVLRELDKVEVKGKSQFVQIYEVLSAEDDSLLVAKQKTLKDFKRGRELYQQKQYAEAANCMRHCVESCSADKAADIWLGRCHQSMNPVFMPF